MELSGRRRRHERWSNVPRQTELGSDRAIEQALNYLNARDVIASASASRLWQCFGTSDRVWQELCQALWQGKAYVPARFKNPHVMSRICAYRDSIADACREHITTDEICLFDWSTRYKETAGPFHMQHDPWWSGQPARTRHFHANGYAFSDFPRVINESLVVEEGNCQWRFVKDDGRPTSKPIGSFVRLGVQREYPTYYVVRCSTNWGWIMHNVWSFSASFPLPLKGAEPQLEDHHAWEITYQEEMARFVTGLPLPHEVVTFSFDGADIENVWELI